MMVNVLCEKLPSSRAGKFSFSGFKNDITCFGKTMVELIYQLLEDNALCVCMDKRWKSYANTENLSNLSPGDYKVTITEANGCDITETYTISLQY
jgi:hypothetical protein